MQGLRPIARCSIRARVCRGSDLGQLLCCLGRYLLTAPSPRPRSSCVSAAQLDDRADVDNIICASSVFASLIAIVNGAFGRENLIELAELRFGLLIGTWPGARIDSVCTELALVVSIELQCKWDPKAEVTKCLLPLSVCGLYMMRTSLTSMSSGTWLPWPPICVGIKFKP